MRFFVQKNGLGKARDKIALEVMNIFLKNGDEKAELDNGINFVFNLTVPDSPQFYRRRARSVFVFSFITASEENKNLRSLCFTTLVHTLSNMVICIVPGNANSKIGQKQQTKIFCTTPEGGFYQFQYHARKVYEIILPIAGAHFAIENQFFADLPEKYWQDSPVVEELKKYSRHLDKLGVLPAPFPLQEFLSEENIKHLYNLFEMKGLSYGNLSARDSIPELGKTTFWMTARGVDKARISRVGKDLLMIKGFDRKSNRALISVPPEYDSDARASVDTIEHQLIYQSFPKIAAVVHIHAWIDGVPCTRQNFPCGTVELAEEVVGLIANTENPDQCIVGLKNHGLTITGPSLKEIFNRIKNKLKLQVPMFT